MAYRIKYRWKRWTIKWRKWKEKLDSKIIPEPEKISAYQEKAIKLWKICLRDKDTQLAYNTSGIRQLEKESLFMIFKPSSNRDYIMTIMDINDSRKSVYEIHVPNNYADDVCDFFDIELERRMREAENNKRSIIDDDLNKLLDQEEKSIIKKKKPTKVNTLGK